MNAVALASDPAHAPTRQTGARAALAAHLERMRQVEQRAADWQAVQNAAHQAAAAAKDAKAALDGIVASDAADLDKWCAAGARGAAPKARSAERQDAERVVAAGQAMAEARHRSWTAVEPSYRDALRDLERLAAERTDLVGGVLLEVGNAVAREYQDAVAAAMRCERQLWVLSREAQRVGAVYAAGAITKKLQLGSRMHVDDPVLAPGTVEAISRHVHSFVERLQANPDEELSHEQT